MIPFINQATFPIATANLDLSEEPDLAISQLVKSTILSIDQHKIGVIGYLTPKTQNVSCPRYVRFRDEVAAIKQEVRKLQAQEIKILIAIGHSGFETDKKIAAEVDGIDLVVGGHDNTFLYTGTKPDTEIPKGPYPTVIVQKNGRKVYVVQAYKWTKYLGNLVLNFDSEGEVKTAKGNPILVDSSIEQAKDVLGEIEMWRPKLFAPPKEVFISCK